MDFLVQFSTIFRVANLKLGNFFDYELCSHEAHTTLIFLWSEVINYNLSIFDGNPFSSKSHICLFFEIKMDFLVQFSTIFRVANLKLGNFFDYKLCSYEAHTTLICFWSEVIHYNLPIFDGNPFPSKSHICFLFLK